MIPHKHLVALSHKGSLAGGYDPADTSTKRCSVAAIVLERSLAVIDPVTGTPSGSG